MSEDARISNAELSASIHGSRRRALPILAPLLLVVFSLVSYRVYQMFGLAGFTAAVGVGLTVVVVTAAALRNLEIAVFVWFVSVLGFRSLVFLPVPGLPDLSLDRLLLAWVLPVFAITWITHGRNRERPYLLEFLIIIHTLFLLVSCQIANPQALLIWSRSYLMPAIAFIFGRYVIKSEQWFMRLLWLLIAVSVYHSITAIGEHFRIGALIWPKAIIQMEQMYRGRAVGIVGNPGVLGTYLGMVLPLQLLMLLRVKRAWQRAFLAISILLSLIGLFYTYTRGPWLATISGVIVMVVIGWRTYGRWVVPVGAMAVLLGIGGFLGVGQDKFLQERMGTEHTITGRINAWGTAYRIWLDHPIVGAGFKTFAENRANYRHAFHVPFFGLIKSQQDSEGSLHDIYMGHLSEEGIVGYGIQIWIYVLIIQTCWRLHRYYRRKQAFLAIGVIPCFLALTAVYLVGGLTFDYRYFSSINSLFYLFGGIATGWFTLHLRGRLDVFGSRD